MQILTFPIVCGWNLHNCANFRRDRMNDCRDIANFQFPIRWPSAILNFSNMQIFTFRTVCHGNRHVPAKFHLCRLHGWGIIKVFNIFNMAAVRHFGFVVRMRGTTSDVLLMVFIIVQNLVEICPVVSIISKFNDFITIWLEIAYSRPFGAVSGDLTS